MSEVLSPFHKIISICRLSCETIKLPPQNGALLSRGKIKSITCLSNTTAEFQMRGTQDCWEMLATSSYTAKNSATSCLGSVS